MQIQPVSNRPARIYYLRKVSDCEEKEGFPANERRQHMDKLTMVSGTERIAISRRRIIGFLGAVIAMMALAGVAGCAGFKSSMAGTYEGPSKAMGEGSARAFVTLDAEGKPTVIGVRISETALSGLPAEPPRDADGWEYPLSLPKEAAMSGYNHIVIDWNPRGHIPIGVYDKPHFDFHFYLINSEKRQNITAKGEDLVRAHKAPAPEFMPEGYILPEGTEVARMGAHAIDPTAPEFNKLPFEKTFIYGFYDGQMIFLEPMMTRAFLETKPDTTDRIKQPKAYAIHAYYPTTYSVKYDPAQREYEITLGSLIYR
jgi:hypothetical protein